MKINKYILVLIFILFGGALFYTVSKKSSFLENSEVVQFNSGDEVPAECTKIERKEIITEFQSIFDNRSNFATSSIEFGNYPDYVAEQINYKNNGETVLIEQHIIGEDNYTFLNYLIKNEKVSYFFRHYEKYDRSRLDKSAKQNLIKEEDSEYFLDENQKICEWYSDANKTSEQLPVNEAIKEMVNFYISNIK